MTSESWGKFWVHTQVGEKGREVLTQIGDLISSHCLIYIATEEKCTEENPLGSILCASRTAFSAFNAKVCIQKIMTAR